MPRYGEIVERFYKVEKAQRAHVGATKVSGSSAHDSHLCERGI